MFATALLWKWHRFAAVIGLSFFGISRPGEPLRETRGSLLLPSDLMLETDVPAYVRICHPKTGRRGGGRVQHITISDRQFVLFLERVFQNVKKDERLYHCSPSSFRRRWDSILRALMIDHRFRLTPGGLRGGGCVHAFRQHGDLQLLLWQMRIKHLTTLENYLQEVMADSVVPAFDEPVRLRVRAAASLFDSLLAAPL
eukprot:Skav222640  [mRNA]  locus=scaffold10:352718:353311:- [translate_table: standard]